MRLTRRRFLGYSAIAATAGCGVSVAKTTQAEPEGFFTLGRRDDHWWLITPAGRPFFSIGLNHIDPASLRYPENIHIWRGKYGGSTTRWIQESVAPTSRSGGSTQSAGSKK